MIMFVARRRHFFQGMFVGHTVDEGHDEAEAGAQRAVVAAQALHHPGILLGHDFQRADDEDNGDDE